MRGGNRLAEDCVAKKRGGEEGGTLCYPGKERAGGSSTKTLSRNRFSLKYLDEYAGYPEKQPPRGAELTA